MSELTPFQIECERRAAAERKEQARIERDLLIQEIQKCDDMTPADKDHFRDALNATYAAVNGSTDRIADLATANVLWARIHVRGFATDARTHKSLNDIKEMLAAHIHEADAVKTEDFSTMKWSTVFKMSMVRAPHAIAIVFVFLIIYGYGEKIIKLFL